MRAELRDRWVEALRSGRYEQASGVLRKNYSGKPAYCCLGVLCDIVAPDHWNARGLHCTMESTREARLSADALERVGMSDEVQLFLSQRNDDGEDFDAIADLIEKYVPITE